MSVFMIDAGSEVRNRHDRLATANSRAYAMSFFTDINTAMIHRETVWPFTINCITITVICERFS